MPKPPLAWFRRVVAHLPEWNEIPLFGRAPPFDWERLSSLLSSRFGLPNFSLYPKHQAHRSGEEIHKGLGAHLMAISVIVSPIPSPLVWIMSRDSIGKLTAQIFPGKLPEILQEGYYRFLLLEVLDAASQLEPLKQLSLQLGDEMDFPEEGGYSIDVELSFGDRTCWGRLVLSSLFRKRWIQHFSSFPSAYVPSELMRQMEVVIGLKTGSVVLSQMKWRELRGGDFIPLERGGYDARKGQGVALLTLGSLSLFQVKIKQNKIELLGYAFTYEEPMAPKTSPEEPLAAIQDLPLEIAVELARLKMTVDQLMHLKAGNALELPIHPDQEVSLTIQGQKVGRAELVYLGEALGVRILEIG